MKYKNIKSFAHNFSHSFINYCYDYDHVIDELKEIARQAEGMRVGVNWLSDDNPFQGLIPYRARKAYAYFKDWLPKHAKNSDIDLSCIKTFKTEIYFNASHQLKAEYYVLDDRDREYVGNINF